MLENLKLHIENGMAFLDFDQQESKVNLLTSENMQLLSRLLDEVKGQKDVKALIFRSLKTGSFIAGADIKEIEGIKTVEEALGKAKAGQDVLNKLDDLPFPTIAVINGLALGGGCELALSCDYRIAYYDDRVQIGLPEVNLGILPGFGGTYRLPRLIGFSESLKMILGGKPVKFDKALKIGLVDRVLPLSSDLSSSNATHLSSANATHLSSANATHLSSPNVSIGDPSLRQNGFPTKAFGNDNLEDGYVLKFVEDILSGKYRRTIKKNSQQAFLDESFTGQILTAVMSKKEILKNTKGKYPAPLAALALIKDTFYMTDRTKILAAEAKAFSMLGIGDVSKNCISVFYLSEQYRKLKWPGVQEPDASKIQSVAVVGAGIMGGGIAHLLSSNDIQTRVKDLNYPAIGQALKVADGLYRKSVKQRRLTQAQAQRKFDLLAYGLDYNGFLKADIVIEAVVENMDVKKKIFKELSENTKAGCVLATNTSALSVTEMARQTKDPSRVIGIHFFNPVHRMPLVEIIKTPQTSPETIATVLAFVKRLKKIPIVVNDACGFVVNRILLAYINEAGRLLEETGDIKGIDKVATDFGMPMGPFELSDEVGLDVGIKVLHTLQGAFGERFAPSPTFENVFKAGYLGKKSGQGFYISQGSAQRVNFKVELMLPKSKGALNRQEAQDRMMLIMINEAARILEEGVASDASVIDAGMIFGTGFPAFRGGLLRYADSLGADVIIQKLNHLRDQNQAQRFAPCALLTQKKTFYS